MADDHPISRRECVVSLIATPIVATTALEAAPPATDTVSVTLRVNQKKVSLRIDPRTTLLDLLREHLALTGTKKGCDHGQCGACTVLSNGRRINSCLSLALTHEGDEITTIEGIATGEELHPIQTAFIEHDGFQCGYCTPGQICSAVALLEEVRRGDGVYLTVAALPDDEIRERMSGNICRCGAYPGIVAAIRAVQGKPVQQPAKGSRT